jgi:mono/diheme cytochrome c family protein
MRNTSARSQPRAPIATLLMSTVVIGCAGGESRTAQSAESAGASTPPVAAVANPGEATYSQICASCHQATGLGVEGTYPPLAGSRWVTGDPAVPIAIVIAGLQGEITVAGKTYNGAMQPWGMLSDDDIANVLTYTRSQWGNSASAVTATEVKAVRDKTGSRGVWTVDELKAAYPGAGT